MDPGVAQGLTSLPPGAPLVDEVWLADQVERERMRQHMRGHSLTAASGFLPIGFTFWVMHEEAPIGPLSVWALSLVLIDVLTMSHALLYLRRERPEATRVRWRRRQIALQSLAGFTWGCIAIWLPESADFATYVPMMLVTVMCLGVIGLIHYHDAVITYTTSIWAVGQIINFLPGGTVDWQLAAALVLILVSLNFYLWESARQFTDSLRNRFYADALSRAYQDLATRDALTGLLNRGEGMRQFNTIHYDCRSLPNSSGYAVILVDVDWFKRVNDTYGHLAGDDVLRAVAGRLREQVRNTDLVARIGGEEFLIVVPCDRRPGEQPVAALEDLAMGLARRLAAAVQDNPISTTVAGAIHVTISVGVAVSTADESETEAFSRADTALYAAKAAGRNQARLFTRAMLKGECGPEDDGPGVQGDVEESAALG